MLSDLVIWISDHLLLLKKPTGGSQGVFLSQAGCGPVAQVYSCLAEGVSSLHFPEYPLGTQQTWAEWSRRESCSGRRKGVRLLQRGEPYADSLHSSNFQLRARHCLSGPFTWITEQIAFHFSGLRWGVELAGSSSILFGFCPSHAPGEALNSGPMRERLFPEPGVLCVWDLSLQGHTSQDQSAFQWNIPRLWSPTLSVGVLRQMPLTTLFLLKSLPLRIKPVIT